jgi:broad specificity phosphatase PhoE
MARVWLIRHAEPTVAIGTDPDLTELGFAQAQALVGQMPPSALRTSPLQRARSTAQALADAWGAAPVVDTAYRELPSPTATAGSRRAWLRAAMQSTFGELGPEVGLWHQGILDAVAALHADTAVVTHALVINAVVGACIGDDRVLHVRPAHASITALEVDAGGHISLVQRGREAESLIG